MESPTARLTTLQVMQHMAARFVRKATTSQTRLIARGLHRHAWRALRAVLSAPARKTAVLVSMASTQATTIREYSSSALLVLEIVSIATEASSAASAN